MPISNIANVNPTGDRLYGFPFFLARAVTIDRLGLAIVTVEAGKSVRLGIYASLATQKPGALILDAGVVSVAAGNFVEIVGLSQSLTKGLYFLAMLSDCTGVFETKTLTLAWAQLEVAGSNYGAFRAWFIAQGYGALPDPFGAGAATSWDGCTPIPRILSQD